MKNRILVFLVFITTILKGQSVDPETFPTVVGEIGNKNLYTNTGGEGKVAIKTIMDSVKITDTISMTYAQFYNTITNNNLQVGKTYILVDFQTVYDQPDYDASGNPKPIVVTKTAPNVEEIWVLALSSNQIADRAYSKTYPKDQIKYDWNYNVTEINGNPAMGRISERIDDRGNRTDYDHREVLFKRYDDGTGEFNQWKDNGNASQEFLTFSVGSSNNYVGDFRQYGMFLSIPFYLSNNIFTQTAIQNKLGALNINSTFTINTIVSTYFGAGNKDILIKGSGVLLKSSMGNQNSDIVITDGEFEIGSNNSNIVLNSNNNYHNIHQIGNQCSNIVVGQLGCIQIEDNSSDIIIADGGIIIGTNATNINIGINSVIYGKGFLDNITLGDNGDILFDFDLRNVIVGNNSDELRFLGICQNITLGDNCNRIYLSNCNTINLATDCRNQLIENSESITIASNAGVNNGCYIQFSDHLIIGKDNEHLYFNCVKPNNGANFMTIGNDNKNCKFYGEFVQFTDGGVNDLRNMQNTNFRFIDDTGWINGINPTNTPEVYNSNSEKTIFKGNGNFYEKHFDGTNEIYTILN
jgi:hypothetical protein